jgi:O-antigen/teichoic acid export membrane protein
VFKRVRKSSLLSGSATYLFSNLLNAAIPFALLPVLTRNLSQTEYGEVAMFQTLLAALSAFTGLSVQGAANRKYYDEGISKQELKHFIGSSLQVLAISSLLVFLVLYLVSDRVSVSLDLDIRWILWAVFVSAAGFVVNIRLGQWLIRKEGRSYGVLQVSQSLVNMALSVILVVILLQGAEGRIVAQVYTAAFFTLIATYLLWKDQLLLLFTWRPGYIKEILSFGVPLMPHIGGLFLLNSVDRFVINSELGLAQAGIYMVGVQLSMVMSIVFDAINKAYVPWLYERLTRNRAREKQKIILYTYLYFAVALLTAAIMFIIGPYLVTLVAGPNFSESGKIIGWLALGRAFGGMYLMVAAYTFYSKRTGLFSLATIVSGLLNVILLILLVRVMGLEGAAIAFAIAMAVRFLLTWWIAQLRHPMPWFSFVVEK